MPPRKLVGAFVLLWWTLGLALLVGSVRTVHGAHAAGPRLEPHLALLGGFEAVAALVFLVPRTLRVGAAGLLLALGVAIGAHAATHQLRWDLLVDAAAVAFVGVHGPLTAAQWRGLVGARDATR